MPVDVGEAAGFPDIGGGVLRPAGLEGLGAQRHQLGQALGEQDQLLDALDGVRVRGLGGGGHQLSPCIFSISRWTEAARPTPPLAAIFFAMASVRNDLNMLSPGPPPKGAGVSTPSNICCSMIDRNEASNFWAVCLISPRLASSPALGGGGGVSRFVGTAAAVRSAITSPRCRPAGRRRS